MKLNNKGFAISSIMYIILILAVVLIALTLSILSSRKLILDKLKNEVLTTVNDDSLTLGQTLKILKGEAMTYAAQNNIEKDSIKISNFETSLDEDIVNKYELGDKYLTMSLNNNTYDIYLGKEKVITTSESLNNIVDIIDYKIYGESIQNGTPTTESPVEIESVGEKTNNKFDLSNTTFDSSSVTSVSKDNNEIVFDNSNSNLGEYFYTTNIESFNLKPNTTYTSKVKIVEEIIQSGGISSGSMNKSLILQDNNTYSSNTKFYIIKGYDNTNVDNNGYYYTTFTTPEDMTNLTYITTRLNGYSKLTFQELMIVEGTYGKDNFPNYEPYGYKIPIKVSSNTEEITTNIYLNEPLRKLGDYVDHIDFKNNKLARKLGSNIYSSELWSAYASGDGYRISNSEFIDGSPVMSNLFKNSQSLVKTRAIRKNYESLYVYGLINDYPTEEDWKIFLTTTPLKVIGPLVTPQDGTTKLPKIRTINGANSIEIDTEIQPSSVEFTVIEQIKQI